jgi:hypothetical protein
MDHKKSSQEIPFSQYMWGHDICSKLISDLELTRDEPVNDFIGEDEE